MLPIAREFQTLFVFWTVVCVAVTLFNDGFVVWTWTLWLLLICLLRDFRRRVPASPLATISPVDGRIIAIASGYDPYLARDAVIYTIQQSRFGEFNLHSPAEGKVKQPWLQDASQAKCLAFWTQTDEMDDVVLEIALPAYLQHASTSIHPGERVGQGQRCGFAAFACTVKVYLPASVKRVGCMNNRVIAGTDTLANFSH
ncbi:MAG: hypothetical protein CBC79_06105 [Gammaproteobacteria bacterium TMED119]|nr:MAG: hypothetical protein CBC79_06105 [Gammaproteobacteria bacterium TMED119]